MYIYIYICICIYKYLNIYIYIYVYVYYDRPVVIPVKLAEKNVVKDCYDGQI